MNTTMIPLGDDEDGCNYVNSKGLMKTKDEIISWVKENAPSPVEITVSKDNISINWKYDIPISYERGVIEPFNEPDYNLQQEIARFLEKFEEYTKNG